MRTVHTGSVSRRLLRRLLRKPGCEVNTRMVCSSSIAGVVRPVGGRRARFFLAAPLHTRKLQRASTPNHRRGLAEPQPAANDCRRRNVREKHSASLSVVSRGLFLFVIYLPNRIGFIYSSQVSRTSIRKYRRGRNNV